MINAKDFCSIFNKCLNDQWGYLPGFDGQVLTKTMIDEKITDENIQKAALKWVGKHVADAGGLFAYAFRAMGMLDCYTSNGSYMHTIFTEFCEETGKLPKGGLLPGMIIFKKRNDKYFGVGLYIGNSLIIEAKSTKVGVVASRLNSEWTYWGKMKNVEYDEQGSRTVVRKREARDMRVLRGPATVIGTKRTVNVRANHSLTSDIIDTLPIGSQTTVLEDCGEFCKIQYLKTGYMKKEFLKEVVSK